MPRILLLFLFSISVVGRLAAAEWGPATTPVPPGVRLLADVAFLEPGRAEKLDIYLPAASAEGSGRAAIVYFHGGGWDHGDKASERERNFGNRLAAAGYVFVSANYVLGKGSWPRNLEDCKNAVRFVRARASEYGVDPERIVAMGTSAGAHLALMVGYTADQPELEPKAPYPGISSRVKAVVDLYGITNLLTRQTVLEDGTPTGKPMDSRAPTVLGATRTEKPALWRLASPVTHITKDSPPTFIAHGLSDGTVNYGQAIELANALRAAGVAHELVLLEGIGHLFHLGLTFQRTPMPAHVEASLLAFLAAQVGAAPVIPRAVDRKN